MRQSDPSSCSRSRAQARTATRHRAHTHTYSHAQRHAQRTHHAHARGDREIFASVSRATRVCSRLLSRGGAIRVRGRKGLKPYIYLVHTPRKLSSGAKPKALSNFCQPNATQPGSSPNGDAVAGGVASGAAGDAAGDAVTAWREKMAACLPKCFRFLLCLRSTPT